MKNEIKNNEITSIEKKLEKGFFGFWVRKYKVSFLLIFLIIVSGIFALVSVKKESTPDIKFGIVSIVTSYPGVSPIDMDTLITEKIINKIDTIDGIKKVKGASAVGISNIVVELKNGVETRDVIDDIKSEIDMLSLPEDSKTPIVKEISTNNDVIFELLFYGDENRFSKFDLLQKANYIKSELSSGVPGISSVSVGSYDTTSMGGAINETEYEIQVLVDKSKIEQLGLSFTLISSIIQDNNKNTPIGNYTVGDLNYDFRFDGELSSIEDLKNIVISSDNASILRLGDISKIQKTYSDKSISKLGFKGNSGFNYVSLLVNKTEGTSIFQASENGKKKINEMFANDIELKGLHFFYTKDMSEIIADDYKNLGITAIQTIALVFVVILIFVGFKESIIASLLIPLSFFITFIVLDLLGLSLNFLTNFSLVLTLGIAIDTVIVIIEGASEKQNLGYNKKSAVLLAVKEFKAPLIAGTLTTLCAFLPMIFLPGVMGKFLAYIPTTVFSTLVAALILALTVSSTLYIFIVKDKKIYYKDRKLESTLHSKYANFLASEREGKVEEKNEELKFRERILKNLSRWYYYRLKSIITKRSNRLLVIFIPIILLIGTFIFLSPKIGFTLFPATDNGIIQGTITAKSGTDENFLKPYIRTIEKKIQTIPEVKVFTIKGNGSEIDVYIELLNKDKRAKLGLRSSFDVEEEVIELLNPFKSEGLTVSFKSLSNGPPASKALGIEFVADNVKNFGRLKEIATKFETEIKKLAGVKNVSMTSTDSPGQFVFQFDKVKLVQLGLQPKDILGELYFYTNGIKAGSIKSKFEDNDIILKIAGFKDSVTPTDIENLIIQTKSGKIRIGDLVNYEFQKSVNSVTRKDGNISITVEADTENGVNTSKLQPKFLEIAKKMDYPDGIYFKSGGENEENAELIKSTILSFFLAVFLIFFILVFQFNSFFQPVIILFSVVFALLGVNVGLYLTGNPYSMTFGIGFIALTGVVVNDAIILIDRINRNLLKEIEPIYAIISASKSRLQPILVTTLTTVFGILPLALQDKFWAGLGFTIVFGLTAGSLLTLFCIPVLYYGLYSFKENRKTKHKS